MARVSALTNRRTDFDAARSAGVLVPLDLVEEYAAGLTPVPRETSIPAMLSRHKLLLVAAALCGLLAGGLLSLVQKPIYRAGLTLEILALNDRFLEAHEVTPTTSGVGFGALEADVATAISILNSRTLIERATRRAGIPAGAISAVPEAVRAALDIEAIRTTRLIAATFESPDAALSSRFLNALGEEFVAYTTDLTARSRRQTLQRLAVELETMREQLRASELELRDYSKAAALVFADNRTSVEQQHLARLAQELSVAAAERIKREASYESSARGAASPTSSESNHTLGQLQLRRAELERGLAELRTDLTDAHPKVRKSLAQLAQAETAIQREQAAERQRVRTAYETAKRREELVRDTFAEQALMVSAERGHVVEYDMLRRQVDTSQTLYEELLRRVQQTRIASMTDIANVRVVDPAVPPTDPVRPRPMLQAFAGMFLGFLVGSGLTIGRDRMNSTLREPGDLSACTGIPELGAIPDAARLPDSLAAIASPDNIPTPQGLAAGGAPRTVISEHVRAILTSILFSEMNESESIRRIVVTSPTSGDGKSTLVSNLALALADIHRRVLVIDADFRKPRMHEIFRLSNQWGLSNLLIDWARRGDAETVAHDSQSWAIESTIENLRVLPAGTAGAQAVNLLYDASMRKLLEHADREFDFILIDTPPLSGLADARILARMDAKVVLVAKAGQTSPDALRAAADRLAQDGTPVLGTVLNAWNAASDPYAESKNWAAKYRFKSARAAL